MILSYKNFLTIPYSYIMSADMIYPQIIFSFGIAFDIPLIYDCAIESYLVKIRFGGLLFDSIITINFHHCPSKYALAAVINYIVLRALYFSIIHVADVSPGI